MHTQFFIVLGLFACCNAATLGKEEVFVVGLTKDGYYEKKDFSHIRNNPVAEEDTIKAVITNHGVGSERVGFHAYFPDNVEISSFSMENEGLSYHGKKTNVQHAQEILKRAHEDGHNVAVYVPRSLTDNSRNYQTSGNNINIGPGHEVDVQIRYIKTELDVETKAENRAHLYVDMSLTSPDILTAEISSPNYPNIYHNNALFTWLIEVSFGNVVSIYFDGFSFEECCDRLTLHDGASPHGHIIAEITGEYSEDAEVSFRSTQEFMFLKLNSDCTVSSKGFKALATAVFISSNTTTESPPKRTTPQYPITFTPRSTTESTGEGSGEDGYMNTTTATTSHSPGVITTTTPSPSISECDGHKTMQADPAYKYLISPGYPEHYANNLDCSWFVRTDSNYIIELIALDIELESCCDKVYVYDGPTSSDKLIAELTGTDASPVQTSQHEMFIRFQSDDSLGLKGFRLGYKSLPGSSNSDSNRSNQFFDVFWTQAYAMFSFPVPNTKFLHYTWHIHNHDPAYTLLLNDYSSFSIASDDYLQVFDGPSSKSVLLCNVTYRNYFPTIYSSGSDLFVEFFTKSNSSLSEFTLRFYQRYENCPRVNLYATHEYQYFSSPGYPSSYYNDMNCLWYIYPSESHEIIEVTFVDADVDISDDLYVDHYYQTTYIRPWHMDVSNVPFYDYSNIRIVFNADATITGRGFQAKYRSTPADSALPINWGTPCPTKSYASAQSGYGVLNDEIWEASCIILPIISNTSSIKLQIDSSDIPNGVAELTVNSWSAGLLATFVDFFDVSDYYLGVFSFPDMYVRLNAFPKATDKDVRVSWEVIQ
ncbi:scavenger receptor cysteine-rich domain-containing protein DMBT1-like [Clavelina lepadiformis]|uniref:scavenger receptor cysteine-rich domain-containing protein DMBT1-like n=1 Tax=Clavelina lepadiformis TaxID=159417 RepID=UPI004042BE8F